MVTPLLFSPAQKLNDIAVISRSNVDLFVVSFPPLVQPHTAARFSSHVGDNLICYFLA